MSNTLPIAPPPPPTHVLRCTSNKSNSTAPPPQSQKKPLLEECVWSLEYPELQKACYLTRICLNKRPQSCRLYNIASILQVGPTCGLTALSMLLGGIPSADHLLREAKERNFSYNGEMFSALQLYQLVCDYLAIVHNNNNNSILLDDVDELQHKLNANGTDIEKPQKRDAVFSQPLDCQMHEGHLNCAKVREALLQGACIFVPYPF